MQALFSKDPQISKKATKTFKEEGPVIILDIDGNYLKYFLSEYANDVTYKELEKIEIGGKSSRKFNYKGMVNKNKQPHGFGRAIETDNDWFYDGQFKEGAFHGYYRAIN